MKKKVITMLLCTAMTLSFVTGCGDSGKEESKTEKTEQVSEEKKDTEEPEEVNVYGLTDSQQKELLDAVKTSLEENYLKPQNLAASEFSVKAYDPLEQNNYDQAGNYIGEDSYEWSSVWSMIDDAVLRCDKNMQLATGAMSVDKRMAEEYIEKAVFADTLDQQWTAGGGSSIASDRRYALGNAVYMGIVEFLNGLDTTEKTDVIYNLYNARSDSGEPEGLTGVTIGAGYNITLFDRAIAENIQFS